MQVDRPTNCLARCRCGFKPDHYSIGYGPRPYDVFCPTCRRQVTSYCDSLGGYWWNIVWLWDKIAPLTDREVWALVKKEGPEFTRPPEEIHYHWSPS